MNLLILETSYHFDDETFELSQSQSRHVLEVLRSAPGSVLRIGLENYGFSRAQIESVNSGRVRLSRIEEWSPPDEPRIRPRLILALPRPKAFRRLLRHAVVLGYKEIHFCHSYRVEKSYWSTPWIEPQEVRKEVLWGLQQAVDVITPNVAFHRFFKPFFEDEVSGWIQKGLQAVCAHPYATGWTPASGRVDVLALGPEGGWIDFELRLMESIGFETASFSKRILSCESALPYIDGHLQALSGNPNV